MELSDREHKVLQIALMLYATSDIGGLAREEWRENYVADRAVAKEAYYKLLCSQAGVA